MPPTPPRPTKTEVAWPHSKAQTLICFSYVSICIHLFVLLVGGEAPYIFEGIPGPPGPARPQTNSPQHPARLPSGTQL